jgi:hypothetical protein
MSVYGHAADSPASLERHGPPRSAAEVGMRQPSVSLAMSSLQSAVSDAESAIDTLLARLNPALGPMPTSPPTPGNGASPNYPCDLTRAIAENANKVMRLAVIIREHTDRLEI